MAFFKALTLKPCLNRVENGVLYAVVSCESADDNFFDALLVKLRGEIGFIKRRVTVCIAETF